MGRRRAGFSLAIRVGIALGLGLGSGATTPALAQADAEPDAAAILKKGEEAERPATPAALEEGRRLYERLLERFPKDGLAPRARLRLGQLLARLGKHEEARARLREARATGKGDAPLCKEAEESILKLPPPPEPGTPAAARPATPAPATPGPATPAKPAPAETGPRAELKAEIARLADELRALVKKAQELEDAGKQGDAFALRAEADRKAAAIEAKKKELASLPRDGKRAERPGRGPEGATAVDRKLERLEKKAEKREDRGEGDEQRRKLMLRRKDDLETAARNSEARAGALVGWGRIAEAVVALEQAARARREAFEITKKLAVAPQPVVPSPPPAAPAAADPFARREQEAQDALRAARAALADAEKAGDAGGVKKARDELALREKTLAGLQAERETANEKAHLERLAEQLRKRGAPVWEIEERLALAHKETELERQQRKRQTELRRELEERKASPDETRQRLAARERENRAEIEKLRAVGEEAIGTRARAELESDLAAQAKEMKARGVAQPEIDATIAARRRELEAKLPGKRAEEKKPAEEPEHARRARRLVEENQRLKKRVEELEKELAALRARLGAQPASGETPQGGGTPR